MVPEKPEIEFPAGFDAEVCSRISLLSNEAYDCLHGDPKNPHGAVCVDNFAFIVRRENGRLRVGIQGSNDPVDFILDARAFICVPDDAPGFPPVHCGFWTSFQALLPHLLTFLNKDEEIDIGGHSLGAGMAVLAAVVLSEMGYKVASVYGFGTPCVGAVKFYNRYQKFAIPTFLLVYGRDGIPFLQPCGVHVAPLIYLDLRARLRESRLPWSWNPLRWKAWRADHSCDEYMVATAKILDYDRCGRVAV